MSENELYPAPVVEEGKRAPAERIQRLMQLSMPPFEQFLEHGAALKGECERANELTEERSKLFDEYRDALLSARGEYEGAVAQLVSEQLSPEEIEQLIAFYEGPVHKVVEKAIGLGAVVANVGTAWQTKVLERCPDTWRMLMENVRVWQEKNTPSGWKTVLPDDAPGQSDGWKKVDAPTQAEEFVPSATPEEEAELARLRGDAPQG